MKKNNGRELVNVNGEIQLGRQTLKIVEYYFDHPTYTQTQIAKDLGLSLSRINYVLNHDDVIKAYPIISTRRKQSRLIPKATKAYEDVLDQNDSIPAKEKAAARVLTDAKVFDAPTIEIKNTFEIKPTDELIRLIQQGKQAANIPSVDTEVIPDDTTPE